jgi:predicted ATPase
VASASGPILRAVRLRRDAVADWDVYPFEVDVVRTLTSIAIRRRVLFFTGENGSGKSTLLEALAVACGFGAGGGSRNFAPDVATGGVERLADALEVRRTKRHRDGFFLRAESFFTVASALDDLGPGALRPYGGTSLHARSHGESFLTLFLERFGPGGLYLLDEPEAALSPARALALLVRMHDLLAADSATQFIIATHSPIVLGFPGAQIVSFDGGRLREIAYRETDAYRLTRRFVTDTDRMLHELFAGDDVS